MHDPAPKEQFVSMDEPRRRLAGLEQYIPDDHLNGLVHELGRFLASYITQSEISPIGFLIECEYAMHDIRTGLNRRTTRRMQNRLTEQLPLSHKSLHAKIPAIAEAIFPAEFAAEVGKQFKELVTESPKSAGTMTATG